MPPPAAPPPPKLIGRSFDFLPADVHALFGIVRLEHFGGRGHGDGVRNLADLEREIDLDGLIEEHLDAGFSGRFEARRCNGDAILSAWHGSDGEATDIGGGCFVDAAVIEISGFHLRARNNGGRRIGNRTGNGSAVALRVRGEDE